MSKTDNKQLMQNIFAEMSEGNLDDAMAEDMQRPWMGAGLWSHTFKGKDAVINELLAAVKETLTEPFEVVAHRFITEGDYVVVEHSGKNTTPDDRHTITNTAGSAVFPKASYESYTSIWIRSWLHEHLIQ